MKFLAKRIAHVISVHYQDFEQAFLYWIWLRGSVSYVIMLLMHQSIEATAPRAPEHGGEFNIYPVLNLKRAYFPAPGANKSVKSPV